MLLQLESNLIDVYESYDTFILQPISEDEKDIFKLYFGKRPFRPFHGQPIQHSIAPKGIIIIIIFIMLNQFLM